MLNCPNCTAPLTAQTAYCPTCGVSLQTSAIPHTWSHPAAQDDQLRVDDLLYNSDVYPRASLGKRFAAHLIDSLVFGVLFVPAIIVTANASMDNGDTAATAGLVFYILLLFLPFVYFIAKDALFRGRSLGKMAMGLMLLDVANQVPCGAGKAIVRNIVGVAIAFVPFGGIVDVVLMLTDAEARRLGDRVCRTQVIEQSAYHMG